MNGQEGPLKEAGGGGGVGPSHARAPLPLERSILWTPRGGSGPSAAAPPSAASPYQLFLHHGALAGINWHVGRDQQEAHFGFLLGRLFRCPESGVHYTVADTAVAARETLEEEGSGDQLMRAWSEVKSVFSGHPGHLVGWYHSHYLLGLVLSEADVDTNARYFSAPWQCSIVVVPDPGRPLGGVFRAPTAEMESSVRPARFYELLDEAPGADSRADSAVVWMNYEADQAVSAAAVPAPSAEAATPGDATPTGPPRQEPPPRPPPHAGSPAASQGAGPRPAPGAPDPGWLAPRRMPPFPEPGDLEPPGNVHLVIPGEGGPVGLLPPRSRRIGRPLLILAALGIAAAAVFLFLPDVWSSLTTSEPDAPPPEATVPETPDSAPSPELEPLLSEVEALEIAGERYSERAGDFEAGLIGCALLTTGYVAADEAYVRVAESYGNLGAENPRATAAYERAGQEMAEVNGHFDASGCQRP